MKQSIIFKTTLILSVVIVFIFATASYLFTKSDDRLISEIQNYNLKSAMKALDGRLEDRLSLNKTQMKETLQMIVKNSSSYLLNFDQQGLKESLLFDIRKENIKGVKVFDYVVGENFLVAIKKNNQVVFVDTIPKEFNSYVKLSQEIIYTPGVTSEKLGVITLFYDESFIISQINNLKKETTQTIENFNHEINIQKQKSNLMKLFILVGVLIIVLVLIAVMLVKFVNKPLQILHHGLDEFFLFLQNKKDHAKKIVLNTNDEFGHMVKSLNENILVSARLHEEIHELNTNLEEKVEEKTAKVTTLLDNAGQGFLTFSDSFLIDPEYSKECEKLLGKDIIAKDITSLLFKDTMKQNIFKESLLNAQKETMEIKRNSYLSLIPKIILLNKKAVKLECKIINNNSKFMMILTNITSEKKLEKKVKKEQDVLKMIVAVVSENETFCDAKEQYQNFTTNYSKLIETNKTPLFNLTNLYRIVHTLKGMFSQLYMKEMVAFLHKLESEVSTLQKNTNSTNQDLVKLFDSQDFTHPLECSLNIIQEILGKEFLNSENYIKVDINDIESLQERIETMLNDKAQATPECKDILCQIQNLSSLKLSSLLNPNISLVKQLAHRLEKEIYPLNIIGDNKLTINDTIKPFIKSLIHVFRNSVDHGIETPEERALKNKDEIGTISCSFEKIEDNLSIIIADDGAGIDTEKIKTHLEKKNIDTKEMNDTEIYNHIFDDNLSTKKNISDISGRGVGMSAVKTECQKIGGEINIKSSKDIGTTFEFIVPLNN